MSVFGMEHTGIFAITTSILFFPAIVYPFVEWKWRIFAAIEKLKKKCSGLYLSFFWSCKETFFNKKKITLLIRKGGIVPNIFE